MGQHRGLYLRGDLDFLLERAQALAAFDAKALGFERVACAAEGGFEIGEINGLGEEIEGAAIHRCADVAHVAIRGEDHGLDHAAIEGVNAREQLEAIHHRHVDVGDHQFESGIGFDLAQSFGAVASEGELEPEIAIAALEALTDQDLDIGLIIHDENARARFCRHVFTVRGRRIVNSVNSPSIESTRISPRCSCTTIS